MSTIEILEKLQSKYFVHPETFDFFKKRTEQGFTKTYFDIPISEARESNLRSSQLFAGDVDYSGTLKDITIPSKDIEAGIPVTVYTPSDCRSDPSILVYFHGGGNCVGSRAGVDTICKILSRDAHCIVVNVEYRMAPEFKFPCNHDDVLCVVQWVISHKEQIGGTANSKIGVGGDSAGGRLAAVVCHEEPHINFQILIYPNVDSTHSSPAHQEFEQGPVLTQKLIQWFMDNYFTCEEEKTTLRGSPLNNDTASFTKLPPALNIVPEIDPLRDNAILYHEKMLSAGSSSDLLLVKGVAHAFFTFPGHFKECCNGPIEKCVDFIEKNSYS